MEAKVMQDRRPSFAQNLWTAVSILAVVVTLYTAYNVVTGGWRVLPRIKTTASDDDVIIVVGGSLEIFSRKGFKKDGGNKKGVSHGPGSAALTDICVFYSDNNDTVDCNPVSGPQSIALTYCPTSLCISNDTVTFSVDNNDRKPLKITNTSEDYGIGDEATATGKNVLHHQPPDWHVFTVTLRGSIGITYTCPNGCRVELGYH